VVVVNVVECGVAATGQGGVAAYLWTLGQGAEGAFLWLRCFCITIARGFQKQIQLPKAHSVSKFQTVFQK
jgi:hypothetical protein